MVDLRTTLRRVCVNMYSSTFSEKFELIKDFKLNLSQTDLVDKYKISNGFTFDVFKRKRQYLVDCPSNQCRKIKIIEIMQRLRLLLITLSIVKSTY